MATGTARGLLDSAKATSVFKHEILRQYVPPFLAKTGSTAAGGRVFFMDGFAGRGRFDDDTKGSAEYFLAAALNLAPKARGSVRLFEAHRPDAERLAEVVAEYVAQGVDATSECADISTRIDSVVDEAAGVPLFMFLDPCGQNLPYETVLRCLTSRPMRGPATEALLNLSADFTRRIAGTLAAGLVDARGLVTMDEMMGGQWWRQVALDVHAATPDGTWGAAADAVALEYSLRLGRATRMSGAVTPVRRKPSQQPVYHLAFFTRSPEGLWVMGDAIARARQKWLEFNGPQNDDDALTLFDVDPVAELLAEEQASGQKRIEKRLRDLVAHRSSFVLRDHVVELMTGDDYGLILEKSVGAVMRELVKQKVVTREPGKKLHQARFTRVELPPQA